MSTFYKLSIIFILLFHQLFIIKAQKPILGQQIKDRIGNFKGKVGVSIENLTTKQSFGYNENDHFPMQSVYKFPLAMAVFHEIDRGKANLNQKIHLNSSNLLPNTHSPLRDKYPEDNVNVTLKEILRYTVSMSDNNGCDILFNLIGGTQVADIYLKKLGVSEINIVGTEAQMHSDRTVQYANFASPKAMTLLLKKFYTDKILSKASTNALWKMMVETKTGSTKLRAKLPKGTVIGHKSGWSGVNNEGFTAATNDVGIIKLANGQMVAISVFVSDTFENTETCDALIADIADLLYKSVK